MSPMKIHKNKTWNLLSDVIQYVNKALGIGCSNNLETDQHELDSATDLTNEKLKAMRKSLRSRSVCSSTSQG